MRRLEPWRPHWRTLSRVPDIDDSLNVVVAYLSRYSPPTGRFPAHGGWRATYDLIEWAGTPRSAAFVRENRATGRLVATRRPDPSGAFVGYDFDYTIRMQGFDSTIRAETRCSTERLPRLYDWTARYESHPVDRPADALKLSEEGRHAGDWLEIASAAGIRRFPTRRPVVSQFGICDALRNARADRRLSARAFPEFDLLSDLTSYRPRQRIDPYGVLHLWLDGSRHVLQGFVQTGVATEPTHTWVDSAGRPILMTAGLYAMALTSIET